MNIGDFVLFSNVWQIPVIGYIEKFHADYGVSIHLIGYYRIIPGTLFLKNGEKL